MICTNTTTLDQNNLNVSENINNLYDIQRMNVPYKV